MSELKPILPLIVTALRINDKKGKIGPLSYEDAADKEVYEEKQEDTHLDLKPKNGFAKYQEEKRANGRSEKTDIVAIEDSNSKILEDVWSMEQIDAETLWHFGKMDLVILTGAKLWNMIMMRNLHEKTKGTRIQVLKERDEFQRANTEEDLKELCYIDSGCSGSMTGDKEKLSDFKAFKGGYVAFGNDPQGGRITGKGTIKTSCIDFEKVSYVEELKFNLLSVSQICDKKHNHRASARRLRKNSQRAFRIAPLDLVHVLLHCLSPKSTSWEQFGTNIAYALVGLATNQKFNFSLLIINGMLGHISNGTPFIMYPRFIQLFLNKQLEGVTRPTNFLPSVTLPSKVFTFMRKNSPKFSGRITPLTPPMLEVVTALAAEEAHSTSPHSRAASSPRDAQGTPSQSAAHDSNLQGTAASQGTASLQGTAESQGTATIPKSPNDYTPTDASQTSGGDEGLLDLYALNREVRRLKKQTLSQAKQIHKLKAKLKKLSKFVQPVVKHHALWVESQNLKKRRKRQRKKHKKKVSSVKVGRNKDEGTLSEEHYVQEDYTADVFFEDIVDRNAAVTPDFERKSDETEEINVEEKEASNVKSGDTEELDLETFQSTARQSTITPRTLNFDDEAGPSSPIRQTQDVEPEEQFKVDEVLADISLNISRPRGLSIPGPIQSQPQQPTQATDPKDKGKGILVEEPKKKKLTLQQIRALETTNDEEVARKIQAEWDAEEERKRLEELKKAKSKTILKKPTSLAQERNQMMNFLKGQGYKNLQKLRYPQMKELYDKVQESIKDSFKDFIPMGSEKEKQLLQERDTKRLLRKRKATISEEKPSKKLKLRTETIDALRNFLRIETPETSDDDFWKNQEDWEIIRWRYNESSGVHTLKLEDGTTIHMLAKRRYPLSKELMIRMLDHGMEVEDESETAITLIHLFILWTTEDGDNS
ncbi:hypothetical protein Tco_0706006 [Tanacetum coccineum]|uniref:Retrovirus-related Pol polyprotein from transposon TNT 1-94-like beta-barrel domain-containing protein n=1 Tax=Tanacetum coccineum TaxID=301880 RepID=A0ABQ4Y869_9ASTR